MKAMTTLRPRALALVALLLPLATPIHAQRREYRLELGAAAASTLARAIGRALWLAGSSGRLKCYQDVIGA